jgi:predicted CoA-substrate-specific enzyme activase
MKVLGIDLGSHSTKVVILGGDTVLGSVSLQSSESAETEVRMAVDEAMRQSKLTPDDIAASVVTGTVNVPVLGNAKQRSASSCIATGAHFCMPQARTILYVGGDSSLAMRLSPDGQIEESVRNDRCAVSSGALLDVVSRMMCIPVDEFGPLSLQATQPVTIASRCTVFAESEILTFIHGDPPVPAPDVLAGVHHSIIDGLWGMVQKVGVPSEFMLCGGLARNVGIVKAMEERLGKPVLVPPQPHYVRALGAALFARRMAEQGALTC